MIQFPAPGRLMSVLALGAILASAQHTPQHQPAPAQAHSRHEEHEGPSAFEAEFVASDIFRNANYVQPLWRRLGFEGHYFGGGETHVGYTGGYWMFKLKELKLSPGFGVAFGNNQVVTTPAVTLRWDFEHHWFVTQGLTMRMFRNTPIFHEQEGGEHHGTAPEPAGYVRPAIADGNHVSARWKRLTVGGTWEHIHFREGDEWKGGARFAFRLLPRLSAILFVLGPGRVEWRGGVLIHPAHE